MVAVAFLKRGHNHRSAMRFMSSVPDEEDDEGRDDKRHYEGEYDNRKRKLT